MGLTQQTKKTVGGQAQIYIVPCRLCLSPKPGSMYRLVQKQKQRSFNHSFMENANGRSMTKLL